MVVETEWMAAAETRMPTATKALAEREASMDGTVLCAAYPCVRLPANSWRATEEDLQEQPRQEVNRSAKVPRPEQEVYHFGRAM